MKGERLATGGAVMAAIAASLCCLGPLLFLVLGLGAFGAAAAFETARPFLLSAAGLLLGVAFYRVYFCRRQACTPDGACETKPVNRASRIVVWVERLLCSRSHSRHITWGVLLPQSKGASKKREQLRQRARLLRHRIKALARSWPCSKRSR